MKYATSQLVHGYANKTLAVDVGTGAIETPGLDPKARDYFIGGRLSLIHISEPTRPY
jgi:hypothetical protein